MKRTAVLLTVGHDLTTQVLLLVKGARVALVELCSALPARRHSWDKRLGGLHQPSWDGPQGLTQDPYLTVPVNRKKWACGKKKWVDEVNWVALASWCSPVVFRKCATFLIWSACVLWPCLQLLYPVFEEEQKGGYITTWWNINAPVLFSRNIQMCHEKYIVCAIKSWWRVLLKHFDKRFPFTKQTSKQVFGAPQT